MKLYAGTTEQFRTDTRMHRIAEKLRAEYTTQIDQAELNDHGVILEYQLGNTSRRLDAMLTATSSSRTR